MDFDFNVLYKISVAAMRFNRTHPDIPRDIKWLLQFILMQGVFTFVFYIIVYSTICHEFKNSNFTVACENGIISFLYIVATFWYSVMLWNQDSLMLIINTMQKDYSACKNLPAAEQTMLMGYARKGCWNMKLWLCLSGGVALLFPLRSMYLMTYYAITDEFRLIPLYEVTYPPMLEKNRDSLVSFMLLYITMLWYCAYAASFYVGLMPLGPIFMLHTCGQLELVKKRAETLFIGIHYDSKGAEKKLKGIVRHSQDIYCFVEHIQRCFNLIYELCLKGTTVTVPVLIYELTETTKNGKFSMEFLMIAVGCVIVSSYPCYYGDLLMELGNSVRQALYCSGWERHWDPRARKTIIMILIRTTCPVVIRAMFSVMTLGALGDVMHHAYAIYNLINAAW